MSVTKRDAVELGYSIRDLVPAPSSAKYVLQPDDLAMRVIQPAPKPAIFRDPGYLVWLRYQRCLICTRNGLRQETSSDPAHSPKTRIHGDVAIPLCRKHHEEEERLQPAAFAATYKIDLAAEFRAQYAEYQRELQECAF